MLQKLEESEASDSRIMAMESHITLDTIQEGKESSSLSGESGAESIADNLDKYHNQQPREDPHTGYEVERQEEKKIKVQWMNEDDDEEDENEDILPEEVYVQFKDPDVDGGWAWVILLANFAIFTICSGLLASTGLYYVQMLKEFQKSRSYTAWMGSLMNAFFMLAGPFCSVIIKKASCRVAIIIGGLLMCIGYLMSAMAYSLPFIFLSYGIVVATGMNFVYSGQIICLAHYFQARHSMATSASMVGIGVGMFFMIRLLDFLILEYGWRASFIYCAGFSLQLCVFGSLIFPLKKKNSENTLNEDVLKKTFSHESIPNSLSHSARLALNKSYILNRSVSSLRLSIGAGYLTSSFSNLHGDNKSAHGTFISSNQHSFCSRNSQYFSGVRSNQHSFCQFHNGEIPNGLLPFLRSNQHSFCSRGSFYAIHSLRSNPHSFSNKNSQLDLHHTAYHHCLPSLKDIESDETATEKDEMMSDVVAVEEINDSEMELTKCKLLLWKIKNALRGIANDLNLEVLLNPCFWLLNFAMFFTMLATIKLFVIYKDLSEALGVDEYYSYAMSTVGIGDILGRVSAGVLSTYKCTNSIFIYGLAMFNCGVVIAFHFIATWGPIFPLVTGLFGFFYGQQNVLITLAPSIIFGKEMLVTIFGYVLFFAGLGALVGAPLAGYIVDVTGSYAGVIILSVSCCFIGGVCMMCCYCISRNNLQKQEEEDCGPSSV